MDWNAITAIATASAALISMVYILFELKALERDRYWEITNQLFVLWQSKEFMEAQLWLMHRLKETTWPRFIEAHRAEYGELAFHRVGSFYNRVGSLVRRGLVKRDDIVPTIGPFAIAIWQKIQPLVIEARRIENSVLFVDFEHMLPECYECYVPALGPQAMVHPFSLMQPGQKSEPSRQQTQPLSGRISQNELLRRMKESEPIALLDVRQPSHLNNDPHTLPHAIRMPPDDVQRRYAELPRDLDIVVYCA